MVGLRKLVAILIAENDVHTTAKRAKNPSGSAFSKTQMPNLA
jgi:hypothetical protein